LKKHTSAATIFAIGSVISSSSLAVELLGVHIGGKLWNADSNATFRSPDIIEGETTTPATPFTLSEVGITSSQHNMLYIELRHTLPLLPRVRAERTNISLSGNQNSTRELIFAGTTFEAGASIASHYTLEQQDFTLFYSLIDSWARIDLGLTHRRLEGQLGLASEDPPVDDSGGDAGSGQSATELFNKNLNMMYVKAGVTFPETNIFASAAIHHRNSGDEHLQSTEVTLNYRFDKTFVSVDLELGYHQLEIESETLGALDSNISFAGPFMGLRFRM